MPVVVWTLATLTALSASDASLERYVYAQLHMGMTFELTLYAADEATANRAAQAAFRRIAELNGILSDYDPHSELSRLCETAGTGQAVKLSDPLWLVLSRSQHLAERTEGAFDVTVGPLVKLWRRARRQKELPDPARLAAARAAVGFQHLKLDASQKTATLLRPAMRVDLGGIGAGFAVDEALRVLREHGIARAMVNASGDIGVSEPPPGADGWKIGIAPLDKPDGPPSRYLLLSNAAVTTSGDAFQHVEIGGQRYSHIVDPHTGLGLTHRLSVTVVARDCITADSLATAASVLGCEHGLKLIDDTPGAAAQFVRLEAGQPKVVPSRRFSTVSRQPRS
jgi:thiamine biosynthesis lipoprotein